MGRTAAGHAGDVLHGPLPAVVKARPALAADEPYKTAFGRTRRRWRTCRWTTSSKIAGVDADRHVRGDVRADVAKWIAQAKNSSWKRPFTDLTYAPMQEVLKYLRENGYRTYIVTGGGQDFVRAYSNRSTAFPPSRSLAPPPERRSATTRTANRSSRRNPDCC